MFKKIICVALALNIVTGVSASAMGNVPYDTYNYDYWDDIVYTPAAYVPGGSVSGVSMGIGAFQSPQGMCVTSDGTVYIADTGNNRIVILNPDLRSVRGIVESFTGEDGTEETFSAPSGLAVSEDGLLYVADTNNKRVVIIDGHTLVGTVENPESELLDENYDFVPLKVTVDYAGRVFVIARNMYQGIMTFDANGDFIGFFGTINVKISLWQRFWRLFSTKEERSKQQLFIATEFTGLDVDPFGFVYASNVDSDGLQAVRRLNPRGEDVIRKGENTLNKSENEYLGGDIAQFSQSSSLYSGPSNIIDVIYRGKGIYSLLDSRRGRIFTYDHEGNLLYIFGGMGDQAGTFRQPTAIGSQDGRVLALDAVRNELITFEQTRYGSFINEAVSLRYDGDETRAVEVWREVLKLNENLEIANAGIGKAYLTAGDNVQAMKYLKLGMSKYYYSIAFKRYRNKVLKDNIGWVLNIALILLAVYIIRKLRRRKKGGAGI